MLLDTFSDTSKTGAEIHKEQLDFITQVPKQGNPCLQQAIQDNSGGKASLDLTPEIVNMLMTVDGAHDYLFKIADVQHEKGQTLLHKSVKQV